MYCLATDSRVLMTVQNCQRKGKNNARLQCRILKRNDEKKDLVMDAALSLSTDMAGFLFNGFGSIPFEGFSSVPFDRCGSLFLIN